VPRSGAYRDFSDRDVDTLRLAAHCRGLGFSVAETKDVLALVTASEPDCSPPDQAEVEQEAATTSTKPTKDLSCEPSQEA
jgi:DNA-binding transcriptional MerR regulator